LQLAELSFHNSDRKRQKDRKISLKSSLIQRGVGTNVANKAELGSKEKKQPSAPSDPTYYAYTYDDTPYYDYSYADNQVDQVVAEISSCAFLLFSDETSFDFCVRDDKCDYCDGATEFTVRWDDVPDLRFQALWLVNSFPNPPSGEVGPELYGASALDGRRRT
jgi:hypothetical protein